MIVLKPGDLVFEHSAGWLGRAIRWFTRGRLEPETWANHVGVISSDPGQVVEALWTVQCHGLDNMKGALEVWRLKGASEVESRIVAREAMAYVGRHYGWWKLLVHGADAFLTKGLGKEVFLFRRALRFKPYPICSWVAAWAYYKAVGLLFGAPPAWVDPDEMHDHVKRHSGWELVWERPARA